MEIILDDQSLSIESNDEESQSQYEDNETKEKNLVFFRFVQKFKTNVER